MALYGTLGENDIAELSASISDTAIDVFVYDTRKDSDGGAWRKRTQHTSWYNETLNTSTRGSRREFPAVAVIVAESNQVSIYDGDDPDLPMWMKFERDSSGSNKFLTAGRTNTAVTADNGIIAWCDTTDAQILKFIEDAMYLYGGGGLYSPNTYIANRNNTSAVSFTVIDSSVLILGGRCNDIAMTVLPNAPIDDATGLPVPTIAVAIQPGISIITDSGTVYDLTPETQSSYSAIKSFMQVDFTKENHIVLTDRQTSTGYSNVIYLPFYNYDQDLTDTYSALPGSFNYTWDSKINNVTTHIGEWKPQNTGEEWDYLTTCSDSFAVANGDANVGLKGIVKIGTYPNHLMVNRITKDYNTGWAYGLTQGIFLSDTDTTNITGTELVTNGTFDSDVSGWTATANNTIIRNASGQAEAYRNGGSNVAGTTISMTSGVEYVITANVIQNGATTNNAAVLRLGSSVDQYDRSVPGFDNGATGIISTTYTPTANIQSLWIYAYPGDTTIIDDISIRLAEKDRSAKNNGLQVFGTITKSAVATGAELVGYSGFSASNYLKQPYNSDLDFGAGDFSIMFWFKTPSGSVPTECLLHRGDGGTGTWGSGKIIQIEFNSVNLAAFLAESAFSSFDTVTVTGTKAATGQWMHYTLVRRGTSVKAYLNGEVNGTASSSRNLSNTSASTWIGERPNSSRPATTSSLALFRMSASAPSDEQIKKIYNHEKELFKINAKATLYGSSDAVTALAYDDDTELLHVGTVNGRSDFQGLCRINNTTTAVSTAISASNSLIVEQ